PVAPTTATLKPISELPSLDLPAAAPGVWIARQWWNWLVTYAADRRLTSGGAPRFGRFAHELQRILADLPRRAHQSPHPRSSLPRYTGGSGRPGNCRRQRKLALARCCPGARLRPGLVRASGVRAQPAGHVRTSRLVAL